MDNGDVEVTAYDTVETQRYKIAFQAGVPLDMIHVNNPESNSPEFVNIEKIIRENIGAIDLLSIEMFLRIKTKKKNQRNIANLRILLLSEELEAEGNTLQNLTKYRKKKGAEKITETVENLNNFFAGINDPERFTYNQLYDKYQQITEIRKRKIEEVRKGKQEIDMVHKKYSEVMKKPPLKSSELLILFEDLEYSIIDKKTGEMPLPKLILSTFDQVTLKENVPHMFCRVDSNKIYQKRYVPTPFEESVNPKNLINFESDVTEDMTIVFKFIEFNNSYLITWYFAEGYIEAKGIKGTSRSALDDIITRLFTEISVEKVERIQTNYQLRLYPIRSSKFILREYLLLYRTIVENQYFQFYVNETTSPYPYKKASELQFRYLPKWGPALTRKDEVIFTMNLGSTMSEDNCIIINAVSYTEYGIYRLFTSMIPAICLHYKEDLAIDNGPYSKLFAKVGPIDSVLGNKTKKNEKLKPQLYDEFPDVFTHAYLFGNNPKDKDKVKKQNLVKVTTDKNLADIWRTETIKRNNEEIPRPVESFYDLDGNFMFWYTSVTKNAPYLRLLKNTKDEKPKYRKVPGSATAESESEKTEGKNIINSLSALPFGRKGTVPASIDTLFNFEDNEPVRYGANVGPNAFLECVLLATRDTSEDEPIEESELHKIRKRIAKNTNPWRLKQQLHDLTPAEITKHLSDVNLYLDPLIFTPALEEYFDLDIFVITAETIDNITTTTFAIPRHAQFYCRNQTDRQCVVVFSNEGIRSDKLQHNHCELIAPDNTEEFVFSSGVSEIFNDAIKATLKTKIARGNDLYQGNYLFNEIPKRKGEIVSQYIDGYGKCRALTYKEDDNLVTVIHGPIEPLNLDHSNLIHPIDFETAAKENIIGRSKVGVWIKQVKNTLILYYRVSDTDNKNFLKIRFLAEDPIGLLDIEQKSSISEYARKEKEFIIVSAYLKWLLEVYVFEFSEETNPLEDFILDHLGYDNKKPEVDYYKTEEVSQVIPSVKNFEEALRIVGKIIPIKDQKVILHDFSFRNKMKYYLTRHYNSIQYGVSPKIERVIEDFFRSAYDFKKNPRTILIPGTSEVSNYEKAGGKDVIEATDYLYYDSGRESPIVYQENNLLYLVQNSILEDFGSALRISTEWIVNHRNIGYHAASMDKIEGNYVIYEISKGSLNPVFSVKDGNSPIAELIDYGEHYEKRRYAALLRL